MFVYCLNNPTILVDHSGELAYPGEIHNQVVKRIAQKKNYHREQRILLATMRFGRADLISQDGQVWDDKRDKKVHINAGQRQVKKYVSGTWVNNPDVPLRVGNSSIEMDSFYYQSGLTTYKVTYRDAGNGVIAYDYHVSAFDTKTATQIATATITTVVSVFLSLLGGIPMIA